MPNNVISKIKIPSNVTYDIKPTSDANVNVDGVFYIVTSNGSPNDTISAETVDSSLTSYYDGLKVALHYHVNTQSTIQPTISINNIGQVNVKKSADLNLTEGMLPGGVYYLTYVAGASAFIMDGYADTYPNPVAGSYQSVLNANLTKEYIAGSDISSGLVYLSKVDGYIYPVQDGTVGSGEVEYDWGLAYTAKNYEAGDRIFDNDLMQNIELHTTATGTAISVIKDVTPVFAVLDTKSFLPMQDVSVGNRRFSMLNGMVGTRTDGDKPGKTFIYVGTAALSYDSSGDKPVPEGYSLKLDLSNHDFIEMSDTFTTVPSMDIITTANSICAINGRLVGGTGGGSSTDYNNPVSGAGGNPPAGMAINAYDLVCYDTNFGIVPLKYYINGTLGYSNIFYDWGLAYCTVAVAEGSAPPEGTLLQQCTLTTTNSAGGKSVPLYAFFDGDGMAIMGTGAYPIISGAGSDSSYYTVSATTPGSGSIDTSSSSLTAIYVGLWIDNTFYVDLSNHDFFTYTAVPQEGTNPGISGSITYSNTHAISCINGRSLHYIN